MIYSDSMPFRVISSGDTQIGRKPPTEVRGKRKMLVIGITTLWVLSVIEGISIKRIRVVGIWLLLYAVGLSQSEVLMHIGVLGGLFNRDEMIGNVEGYIYIKCGINVGVYRG